MSLNESENSRNYTKGEFQSSFNYKRDDILFFFFYCYYFSIKVKLLSIKSNEKNKRILKRKEKDYHLTIFSQTQFIYLDLK